MLSTHTFFYHLVMCCQVERKIRIFYAGKISQTRMFALNQLSDSLDLPEHRTVINTVYRSVCISGELKDLVNH